MKNKIILISIFLIAGLVFSACSRPNDSTSSSEKGVTKAEQKPSHKDEYGCVFADEYEWCCKNLSYQIQYYKLNESNRHIFNSPDKELAYQKIVQIEEEDNS